MNPARRVRRETPALREPPGRRDRQEYPALRENPGRRELQGRRELLGLQARLESPDLPGP